MKSTLSIVALVALIGLACAMQPPYMPDAFTMNGMYNTSIGNNSHMLSSYNVSMAYNHTSNSYASQIMNGTKFVAADVINSTGVYSVSAGQGCVFTPSPVGNVTLDLLKFMFWGFLPKSHNVGKGQCGSVPCASWNYDGDYPIDTPVGTFDPALNMTLVVSAKSPVRPIELTMEIEETTTVTERITFQRFSSMIPEGSFDLVNCTKVSLPKFMAVAHRHLLVNKLPRRIPRMVVKKLMMAV